MEKSRFYFIVVVVCEENYPVWPTASHPFTSEGELDRVCGENYPVWPTASHPFTGEGEFFFFS
jgi:hypothetical protein